MPSPEQSIRVNQIILAPHRGHSNDLGEYDRGHDSGPIAEVDVLQQLCQAIEHEFDDYGLRWYTLDVFRRPGVRYADRPMKIEPHSIVLDLRCGWYKSPRSRNMSAVWYGNNATHLLAERFHEALSEWGACTNFGHRVAIPKLDGNQPIIGRQHIHGVRMDLFAMNGPEVDSYCRRLRELGRDLAVVVVDFLRGKDAPAGVGRGVYVR